MLTTNLPRLFIRFARKLKFSCQEIAYREIPSQYYDGFAFILRKQFCNAQIIFAQLPSGVFVLIPFILQLFFFQKSIAVDLEEIGNIISGFKLNPKCLICP